MNQLREICRVITVVENATKKIECTPNHVNEMKKAKKDDITLFDGFLPRTQDVIDAYKERYGCTRYEARNAFKDASDQEYVSTFNTEYIVDPDKKFNTYVEVNSSGRTLNSTIFKIPTGRYNTWLKDNSSLMNFLFGSGITAVLAIAGFILNRIYG